MGIFIFFATINSIYSTIWDLAMDWSLLQPTARHRFLRPVLSYKRASYYYAAMVLDVILRFNWIFYAIFTHDTQHNTTASFFISFAEANRRGLWTIFRVENEHAANVSRFKASRDVPLPYKLRRSDSEETEGGKDKGKASPAEDEDEDEARDVLTPQLGTVRSHTGRSLRRDRSRASGKDVEPEAGGASSTLRRRNTLTRIFAEAHTQDFEKKRRPGGGSKGEGSSGDLDGDARSSDDDEGDAELSAAEMEDDDHASGEGIPERAERVVKREGRRMRGMDRETEAGGVQGRVKDV
jgi:hypothetical protein